MEFLALVPQGKAIKGDRGITAEKKREESGGAALPATILLA